MRKREELTNPASCLNRAAEDEMLFVLLGRDAAAPAAVRAWIAERIRLGKNKADDPQIRDAEEWIKDVLFEQQVSALVAPAELIGEPSPANYAARKTLEKKGGA
jgi:hypothetical protein